MEILILNKKSPEDSSALLFQKGDIIDVRPNGFEWGNGERDEQIFKIISTDKLKSTTEEAKRIFCQPQLNSNDNIVKRRLWQYDEVIHALRNKKTQKVLIL